MHRFARPPVREGPTRGLAFRWPVTAVLSILALVVAAGCDKTSTRMHSVMEVKATFARDGLSLSVMERNGVSTMLLPTRFVRAVRRTPARGTRLAYAQTSPRWATPSRMWDRPVGCKNSNPSRVNSESHCLYRRWLVHSGCIRAHWRDEVSTTLGRSPGRRCSSPRGGTARSDRADARHHEMHVAFWANEAISLDRGASG
jgi:hypothetical protein